MKTTFLATNKAPTLLLGLALISFSSYASQDAFDELEFETGGCEAELNDAKRRVSVCEASTKQHPALQKELSELKAKFAGLEYGAKTKISDLEKKLRDIQYQVRTERRNNQRLRNEIIELARPSR